MVISKPGVYDWLPLDHYHKGPGFSNSQLTLVGTRSPAHVKHAMDNPSPSTDAQRTGEAFHCLTLEPHLFRDRFYLFEGDLRSKAKKEEWAEAEEKGLIVLREKQLENVKGMGQAVRDHPDAQPLLYEMKAQFEKSVYWKDSFTGLLCKVRPDIVPDYDILNAIGDLKSCRAGANRNAETWGRQIGMYRYHVQAAYYLEGCRKAWNRDYLGFYWITVESEAPYGVNVYMADREMIEEGRRVFRRDLNVLGECVKQNMWPGYEEGVKTVSLLPWDISGARNPDEGENND